MSSCIVGLCFLSLAVVSFNGGAYVGNEWAETLVSFDIRHRFFASLCYRVFGDDSTSFLKKLGSEACSLVQY